MLVLPNNDAESEGYIWYVAVQIMCGGLGPNGEVDIPEEISACHDVETIKEFCTQIIEKNPKFVDLYRKGKTGPLLGAILKASYGRIEGDDIRKVLEEILHE